MLDGGVALARQCTERTERLEDVSAGRPVGRADRTQQSAIRQVDVLHVHILRGPRQPYDWMTSYRRGQNRPWPGGTRMWLSTATSASML